MNKPSIARKLFTRRLAVSDLRVALSSTLIAVCLSTGTIVADDWPRWMGPQYDGIWRETGMIDNFPESGPKVIWREQIGAGYGGPAIADGKVFVMDRTEDQGEGIKTENDIRKKGPLAGGERIRCLDQNTGAEIWALNYDCTYEIAYPTGPRCTPTIDGEFVYTLGAMGHLKCLKVADGTVLWEQLLTEAYDTKPPLWGFASHPYVDGDHLIVPTGGTGSGLVAFDKRTGKEVWKAVTTNDIGYAPVVIYDPQQIDTEPTATDGQAAANDTARQLIFWHGQGITSVDPTNGTELWHVKFPEEPNPSIVTIATPMLVGNRLLIAEFYKGAMLLEIESTPPGAKEVWRNFKLNPKLDDAMNAMMATPIVVGDLAYGVAYNRRGQGILRCVELSTGQMKWSDDKWLADKPLPFANGFITPNEDKVFIFNDLGELMIGRFTPERFVELDRAALVKPTSVARGRDVVWSHPAYGNGKVVVRNDEEIICVDLKK